MFVNFHGKGGVIINLHFSKGGVIVSREKFEGGVIIIRAAEKVKSSPTPLLINTERSLIYCQSTGTNVKGQLLRAIKQ